MNITPVLGSVTAAALIGAIVAFATPATQVKARDTSGVKTNELSIQKFETACSQQTWPYYEDKCVRDDRSATGQSIKVRFISMTTR